MTQKTREFKGKHLALIMVCFFGVIVSVNMTMAYIATSNWTGLVVKNSYVASQHFNSTLDAAKRQRETGWKSDFTYQSGIIDIALKDGDGKPLNAGKTIAEIGRPAFEQMDHKINFTAHGKGLYRAQDELAPGLWQIIVIAEIEGQPYRRDIRLFVTDDGVGVIQ